MRYKLPLLRILLLFLYLCTSFEAQTYASLASNTDTTESSDVPPTENPGNTAFKLIIIIVIPTLAITVICVVCVVIGVRKTRNSGRKWWKIYGTAHPATASQLENADPQTKLELSIAQMNHYMDIKSMANQFKKDQWEIKPKDLLVHDDCLGNGAFACVFRGTLKGKVPLFKVYAALQLVLEHTNGETSEVAVKKLPAHANHEGRVDFFHEMSFMKRLGYHPHVISMLGCISNPIDPLIVVEYCKHGDLLGFLRKNKGSILGSDGGEKSDYEVPLKVKDLVSIAWQVCDGLCYLSSHKFIHRDVAARNILLTKGMCAKISDFGLCRYADSALYTAKGGRLPIKWMSPESLKFYEYTEKTEVWSYGIMLHEMFSLGESPYPSVQPMEMIQYLEEGNRMRQPIKCPNEMHMLMRSCWEFKAENRPTFDELRAKIAMLLNLGDEQYGYLSLPDSKGPETPMGTGQLTYQTDECKLTPEMLGKTQEEMDEEAERASHESPHIDMAQMVEMKRAWMKKKKAINEKLQINVEIDEANDKAIISRDLLNKMRQLTASCENLVFRMPSEESEIKPEETAGEIKDSHSLDAPQPSTVHEYENVKRSKSLEIPTQPTRRETYWRSKCPELNRTITDDEAEDDCVMESKSHRVVTAIIEERPETLGTDGNESDVESGRSLPEDNRIHRSLTNSSSLLFHPAMKTISRLRSSSDPPLNNKDDNPDPFLDKGLPEMTSTNGDSNSHPDLEALPSFVV